MDKKFTIIPKEKKDPGQSRPVSTRLPVDDYDLLYNLALKNNLNVLELAQQMLLHCLRETKDD